VSGMLLRQTRHDLVGVSRTPAVLFFALFFPLVFFLMFSALLGNETLDDRSGVRLAQFLAPALASFGLVMATFSVIAVGFAEIRFSGVLKRLSGTPLPPGVLLGGRVLAASALALVSVALLFAVGAVGFDVEIIWENMGGAALVIIVAVLSFSAMGLAIAAWAPSFQAASAMANGFVIPLAFISDMFLVGADLPDWLDTVGWVFPLKPLVNELGDAFNPFVDYSLEWAHVATILAWGLIGAVLFVWGISRSTQERGPTGPRSPSGSADRGSAKDATPRRDGRPSAVALITDQVVHTQQGQLRDWSASVFGLALPLFLILLIPLVFSGEDTGTRTEIAQTVAASMTMYGVAVISYVNMPTSIAEARDAGVLKRWAGAPLPTWAILAGRVVAAIALALVLWVLAYALAVPIYDVVIPSSWPSALLMLLLAATSFVALGMAVVSLVHGQQAVLAVCLGSLLVLAFISEIFLVDVELPPVIDAISWIFPLRHAVRGFSEALAADASGIVLSPENIAVIAAWGILGALVTMARFTNLPSEKPTPSEAEAERLPGAAKL
jgi:ABC-2 type transport system permease protein